MHPFSPILIRRMETNGRKEGVAMHPFSPMLIRRMETNGRKEVAMHPFSPMLIRRMETNGRKEGVAMHPFSPILIRRMETNGRKEVAGHSYRHLPQRRKAYYDHPISSGSWYKRSEGSPFCMWGHICFVLGGHMQSTFLTVKTLNTILVRERSFCRCW
jgi:hypothetical protein